MKVEYKYENYGSINESIPGTYDQSYYNQTADEYHAMYSNYLPQDRNSRVLDIGCGKGFFLYYLIQQGYINILGIDADLSSIEHTKEFVTKQCQQIDAEDYLSDKNDYFDLVVMNEVLEHIPKEQIIPLLKMIHNSLREKGIIICYVPNMENPFTSYTRYHDFTHTIGFTQNSLKMVLNAAGFKSTSIVIPGGQKKGAKKVVKKLLRQIIKRIFMRLFEYPSNGIIHASRIFSVSMK
jgi:2-polyprenyl-3-methyl-5-hydroxy-6-metoxy-1,4-benzoquinol methylase